MFEAYKQLEETLWKIKKESLPKGDELDEQTNFEFLETLLKELLDIEFREEIKSVLEY